jgi:hypothetical protein
VATQLQKLAEGSSKVLQGKQTAEIQSKKKEGSTPIQSKPLKRNTFLLLVLLLSSLVC